MTGSKNSGEGEKSSPSERGDDSDDEGEILEESSCGRWSKRRKEIQQRDIPGVDAAYLAMDTEEGMEVVWNEVIFSENRRTKEQEEKIKHVFDNLSQLDHPNIVKLHKYWIDNKDDKKRVVFITEYMSSGSLKKFLKLTKRNVKRLPLQSWKRWCTQILSSLSYLHSCSPPIIHGNLTTDSVFIQHNGLIKIGSVAPDAIQTHVKTFRGEVRNLHYIAPEFEHSGPVTPAADIYSFGMCALETAALEIPGNGDSGMLVSKEQIQKTINSLEHPLQKDFITKCLNPDPRLRPNATQLLFHPLLFEVHSLKLLAAHSMISSSKNCSKKSATLETMLQKQSNPETIIAVMSHPDKEPTVITMADVTSSAVKLREFIEDVRNGIYPLTAFQLSQALTKPRPATPAEEIPMEVEPPTKQDSVRTILNMMCAVRTNEDGSGLFVTLSLRLENKMNRQLTGFIEPSEIKACPDFLSDELVHYEFIHPDDHDRVRDVLRREFERFTQGKMVSEINGEFYPPNQFVVGGDTFHIQFQHHQPAQAQVPGQPQQQQQHTPPQQVEVQQQQQPEQVIQVDQVVHHEQQQLQQQHEQQLQQLKQQQEQRELLQQQQEQRELLQRQTDELQRQMEQHSLSANHEPPMSSSNTPR